MKKWSKLVLVAMVSVGTMLVSGCIENIEPAGIANLRGAKAELLRAQTALQAAQAAKVEAEAALVVAQSKVQEAIAKQEEAKALMLQYQAELQQAQNEVEKAALEQRIAELQAQAAVTAENLKAQLLNAQAATAAAQAAYEQALKDLAIAKNSLTPEQQGAIAALERQVAYERDQVELKTAALQNAAVALTKAVAQIDENGKSTLIAGFEFDVVIAEASLEAAIEAEAEAKALLEVDKTLVDWDAKAEEYEAEMDSLARASAVSFEKYNEAIAEVMVAMEDIDDMIETYEDITGYEFEFDTMAGSPAEMGTGTFSKIQGPQSATIPVPDVYIKNDVLGDFIIDDESYYFGKENEILKLFDKEIMGYEYDSKYYVNYHRYEMEQSEADIAAMETEPVYLEALERYNDAVAATESGDYLAYFAKYHYPEDYDFADAVAEYNAALKAFKDAIAEYEAAEVKLDEVEIAFYDMYSDYYAEKDAIDSEKAKGYQDAEKKYAAADVVYEKAKYANELAKIKRDRAIAAAEAAAGAERADMEAFEATYVEAAADEDAKAKHALYVKALADIKKAEETYDNPDATVKTDPASVWAAAQDQWAKDKKLYDYNGGAYDPESVYAAIDAAYNEKTVDITTKYSALIAQLAAGVPNVSGEYTAYWMDRLGSLRADLQYAVVYLSYGADGYIREYTGLTTVEYSVNLYNYDGTPNGEFNLDITDVPSYLYDNDGLVEVVAEDLVDAEYFVENEVIPAAGALWYDADIEVDYTDGNTELFTIYADETAGWPYELPDYDTFVDMFRLLVVSLDDIRYLDFTPGAGYLADIYLSKLRYEFYAIGSEDYYAAIPDHIIAVEEARAEFVAYVIEKEAELEAIKTEVEEAVASFVEFLIPIYTEHLEVSARYQTLENAYGTLVDYIIPAYIESCYDGAGSPETLAEFEAALLEAYNDAVEARIDAEKALAEAEWALAEAEAGNITAVEIAQVKYDRAVEELAEAIAKLNRAAASLEAVLDAIYNDQPVPETPADPEGDEDAE